MFIFKILIFLVKYYPMIRHCEVRSNLYAVQRHHERLTYLHRDCFVPRNNARIVFIHEISQPTNANQISLSTLRFLSSLVMVLRAFFFLASLTFLILAASARSKAASVLLRS